MRVLRGTLTFILGMIIGIILFVIAIGGAVYIIGTSVTVRQLQESLSPEEIISSDSEIYDKTLWDTALKMYQDFQNFGALTLETLYKTYGLKLLNGVGEVDFTVKDFYKMPLSDLLGDMSVVLDSFTLNDVGSLAKLEFPDLPIINDNLDVGMRTAIENIMSSINENLTVRDIQSKFGIDIGIEANEMIKTLQDVKLSSFGDVLNLLRLNKFINTDADVFVPYNEKIDVYGKLGDGIYQEVSEYVLKNDEYYTPPVGVETFIAGVKDADGDGKNDALVEKELRYVKKTTVDPETNEESTEYVVDNSCYNADFDFENNEKTFYRRVLYTLNNDAYSFRSDDLYVLGYANRVVTLDGHGGYTLVQSRFFPLNKLTHLSSDNTRNPVYTNESSIKLSDLREIKYLQDEDNEEKEYVADRYGMTTESTTDGTITKDSRIKKLGDRTAANEYIIVHKGTASQVLQLVAFMTVEELQDSDDMLDTITIGDVVDTEASDTAKILKALADCKLSEIGTKVDTLALADMIDIKFDEYTKVENAGETGKYVLVEETDNNGDYVYVNYDSTNVNAGLFQRYDKGHSTYYLGDYMRASYFTLYNPAVHGDDAVTYNKTIVEGSSSKVLQRLAYSSMNDFSDSFGGLTLGDVMDIDADIFKHDSTALNPDVKYYYYDSASSLYMRITESNKATHESDAKYFVESAGTSQAVLKRLAFVKVDDLSSAMEKVMKDMMLSELIDVYNEYAVELDETQFDVSTFDPSKKDSYRFFIEDTDGDGYVYAYNDKGKYVRGNWRMDECSAADLEAIANKYDKKSFEYKELTNVSEAKTALASYNIYYKGIKNGSTEPVYDNNISLCSYIIASAVSQNKTVLDPSNIKIPDGKLYTRVESTSGQSVVTYGEGSENIYVLINGTYSKYTSTNYAHLAQEHYYTKTEGDLFIKQSQPGIAEIQIVDGQAKVVVSYGQKLSANISRYKAESVYFKTDASNATHVYIDNKYVEYDSTVHTDSDLQFFIEKKGYIAKINEIYLFDKDSGFPTSENAMTAVSVTPIREKSQAVLRMLASKETTIDNINDAVENATIADMMEVDEDSLFARFKESKIDDLSDNVEEAIKSMSVGELLEYINISTVNPQVKSALQNVVLTDFFNSLHFDENTGFIIVDMEKACGYDTSTT